MRFSKMLDQPVGKFSLLEVIVIALVVVVLYLLYKSFKNNFGASANCSDPDPSKRAPNCKLTSEIVNYAKKNNMMGVDQGGVYNKITKHSLIRNKFVETLKLPDKIKNNKGKEVVNPEKINTMRDLIQDDAKSILFDLESEKNQIQNKKR